jgi:hypothetical protein
MQSSSTHLNALVERNGCSNPFNVPPGALNRESVGLKVKIFVDEHREAGVRETTTHL